MKHRTLVTIDGPGKDPAKVEIDPITWRTPDGEHVTFELTLSGLPPVVLREVEKGVFPIYLLCQANLGADTTEELDLTDFELAPEPDPDDGLV